MPLNRRQNDRIEFLIDLIQKKRYTKSEILDLYEKHDFSISSRALNYDLSYLESMGADIHRPDRNDNRYYFNTPYPENTFDDEDIEVLKQAIQILRNTKGFRIAGDLEDVLKKSKFTRYAIDNELGSIVYFEDHTQSVGIQYLDDLFHALNEGLSLTIFYQSFNSESEEFPFSPYFLKEYRNRWYVMGYNHIKKRIYNLGLDRIKKIKPSDERYYKDQSFEPEVYFNYLIGVTIPEGEEPMEIRLKVFKKSAAYVKTKPIFKNQKLVEELEDGSIIVELKAFNNYELKQNLLGFGAELLVLAPQKLVDEMREIFEKGRGRYNDEW